jgi:hypothetical protein
MDKPLNVAIKPNLEESFKITQDSIAQKKTLIVVGAGCVDLARSIPVLIWLVITSANFTMSFC